MLTTLLKIKCLFSGLFSDILPMSARDNVLKDRTDFRIEDRYVRSMAGRIRAAMVRDGMIKNLLGKSNGIMVEVALDHQYAIVSFFETTTIRQLDSIEDVQRRMRMEIVNQPNLGRSGVFRYIHSSLLPDHAHHHPELIFDPTKPLLVLQPTHWAEIDIFGPIRYESETMPKW